MRPHPTPPPTSRLGLLTSRLGDVVYNFHRPRRLQLGELNLGFGSAIELGTSVQRRGLAICPEHTILKYGDCEWMPNYLDLNES